MPTIDPASPFAALSKAAVIRSFAASLATMLAGCGATTPTLPTADESNRRPVNSAIAVELQACRAEASAIRQTLNELHSSAGRATNCQAARVKAGGSAGPMQRAVFVYEMAQSKLELNEETRQALREAAEHAELIHVHGRSDAAQETAIETQMARLRAEAAAATLVQLGIPQDKLRVTWLGLGDPRVAEHERRRVEVDFIGQAPRLLISKSAAAPLTAARPPSPAIRTAPAAQPVQAANKPATAAEPAKTSQAPATAPNKS